MTWDINLDDRLQGAAISEVKCQKLGICEVVAGKASTALVWWGFDGVVGHWQPPPLASTGML